MEMPESATLDQEISEFKAELADELDWETAQINTKEGIIYT